MDGGGGLGMEECVGVRVCGWWGCSGWIRGCTEVRNVVYEISVTQFQCARGLCHDRNKPSARLKIGRKQLCLLL